jgi:hypothetical protein
LQHLVDDGIVARAQGTGVVSIIGGNVSVAFDGCALSDLRTVRAATQAQPT